MPCQIPDRMNYYILYSTFLSLSVHMKSSSECNQMAKESQRWSQENSGMATYIFNLACLPLAMSDTSVHQNKQKADTWDRKIIVSLICTSAIYMEDGLNVSSMTYTNWMHLGI